MATNPNRNRERDYELEQLDRLHESITAPADDDPVTPDRDEPLELWTIQQCCVHCRQLSPFSI